jgi:type I restriction enzyme, S subunit
VSGRPFVPSRPLEDVATIVRDAIAADAITRDTLYVGLEHIASDGTFVGVTGVDAGELASNKFRFGPQHILFGKLRPYLKKTARPDFEGVCSTDILPILPGPGIDRGYLFHFLRHPRTVEQAVLRCAGANLPRLSPRHLATFAVPVPPLHEQRRIADILDRADAIRRKRKETVALADELLRSAFFQMVGPGALDYAAWPVRTIESLASPTQNSMRTGPFGSDLLHSEFVNEGVAVLGIDNAVQNRFAWDERRFITRAKYEKLRRYTVFPGDVIVTIMGTTGRSAVVPHDIPTAITTKHLATITLARSHAEPEFVSQALFRHPEVLRQIAAADRGAIMSGLNLGLIKGLRIPVPPLAIQRAFAEATRKIRGLAAKVGAGDDAEALFNSLLGRAFSGRLPSTGAQC